MRCPPIFLDAFRLRIAEQSGCETVDGGDAALIAAGEIRSLTDAAFRRSVGEAAIRPAQHSAGNNTVRLVFRILSGVIATVTIELPLLAG